MAHLEIRFGTQKSTEFIFAYHFTDANEDLRKKHHFWYTVNASLENTLNCTAQYWRKMQYIIIC